MTLVLNERGVARVVGRTYGKWTALESFGEKVRARCACGTERTQAWRHMLRTSGCVSCRPSPTQTPTAPRFESKVDRSGGPGACHLWTGSKIKTGYGRVQHQGAVRPAHRVAWILANGDIEAGLCVCHRCDNPACVNVAHLFLGTQKDNVDDMRAKGRGVVLRGESNGHAKLTAEQVSQIRTLAADGESDRSIAARFGVSPGNIWNIKTNANWRSEKT